MTHVYLVIWSNNGVGGDSKITTLEFGNILLKLKKIIYYIVSIFVVKF